MASILMDIREHGFYVDENKRRVQCNYCSKQMTDFRRLKCHLGGVGPDVTSCEDVPLCVKKVFRDMVTKGKPGLIAAKRVGEVQMSHKNGPLACKRVGEVIMSTVHKRVRSQDSPENENTGVEAAKKDFLTRKSQKCIARHFYENCIEFSVVNSPSFEEMMTVSGGQMQRKIPDSHDLKGWMLQEALKEVQVHVKKIEDSWEITGCSILLDAWVDQKGRDLVAFVADCPAGPVYLKSFDVSVIKNDVTSLISLVDRVVQEIGVHKVIQILACSTFGWVGELGKHFTSNNNEVFWSVSVSHCFELMLARIRKLDCFEDTLGKISNISEFMNNNPSVLKLFRDHIQGVDATVYSSEFEFVMPYLTLESIFKARNDLAAILASAGWDNEECITISKLVNDFSFWQSVERIVKSTSPLIHDLLLFLTTKDQHVGYIYDTMNGIKESIASEFSHKELCYKPIWDVIDDVWNKHLHSPLHAVGYFLNPRAFYSTDFHFDPKVCTSLYSSLVRMVEERRIHLKVSAQLDMYTLRKDCFSQASQADQYSEIPPAELWAQKANKYPELQSLAIKILSQTCEGASKYKLKRCLAEKLLLTEGMSHCERQNLEDLVFVHYNLHLQSCKAKLSEGIVLQDV